MQEDVRCLLARVNRSIKTSSNTHLINEVSKTCMQHDRVYSPKELCAVVIVHGPIVVVILAVAPPGTEVVHIR